MSGADDYDKDDAERTQLARRAGSREEQDRQAGIVVGAGRRVRLPKRDLVAEAGARIDARNALMRLADAFEGLEQARPALEELRKIVDDHQNDSLAFDVQAWEFCRDALNAATRALETRAVLEDAAHDLQHPRFKRRT